MGQLQQSYLMRIIFVVIQLGIVYGTCVFEDTDNGHTLHCTGVNKDQFMDFRTNNPVDNVETLILENFEVDKITSDIFQGFPKIVQLQITGSNIIEIPEDVFSAINSVTKLDLSHCGIKTIHPKAFKSLSKLTVLVLSHNEISDCNMFERIGSITDLKLDHNKIAEIKDYSFVDLEYVSDLDLSHNQIVNMSANTFQGVLRLKHLNLENNKITKLKNDVFSHVRVLQWLSLANNHMQQINDIAFKSLRELMYFSLRNNPIESIPTKYAGKIHKDLEVDLNALPCSTLTNLFTDLDAYSRKVRKNRVVLKSEGVPKISFVLPTETELQANPNTVHGIMCTEATAA